MYLLPTLYFVLFSSIITCPPAEAQNIWYKECVKASVEWGHHGATDNYRSFTIHR